MNNTYNKNRSNHYKFNQLKHESALLKNELEKLYTSITLIEKKAPRNLPENQNLYHKIDNNISYITEELSKLHKKIISFENTNKNSIN